MIDGVPEAVAELRRLGISLLFVTNNATRTVDEYVSKLESLGIPVQNPEILTSAGVTGDVVEERGWTGRSVFVIGGSGIRSELVDRGLKLLEGREAKTADLVVVSGDPSVDYDALRTATYALLAGADFIATNADPQFPAPDGVWPGAGAILAALEVASGRRAEVLGKPHDAMMRAVERRLEGAEKIAVVGDQDSTDLAGARIMGWMTILVLSGVTSSDDAQALAVQPDLIIPSLAELPPLIGD